MSMFASSRYLDDLWLADNDDDAKFEVIATLRFQISSKEDVLDEIKNLRIFLQNAFSSLTK